MLDMARALPPEHPAEVKHLKAVGGVVFYRMLRPEFLQKLKSLTLPPLSADGLSNWGKGEGSKGHNNNIRHATRFLIKNVIPALAQDIAQGYRSRVSKCPQPGGRGVGSRRGCPVARGGHGQQQRPPARADW